MTDPLDALDRVVRNAGEAPTPAERARRLLRYRTRAVELSEQARDVGPASHRALATAREAFRTQQFGGYAKAADLFQRANVEHIRAAARPRSSQRQSDLHQAAAKAMLVAREGAMAADPEPHLGHDMSRAAHDASSAARPPIHYYKSHYDRAAKTHDDAALAHAVSADHAADAGDDARELHHRYWEAHHVQLRDQYNKIVSEIRDPWDKM